MTSAEELKNWIDGLRIDLAYKRIDEEGVLKLIELKKKQCSRNSFERLAAIIYPNLNASRCWEIEFLEGIEAEFKSTLEKRKKETMVNDNSKISLKVLVDTHKAEFNSDRRLVRMVTGLHEAYKVWDDNKIPRLSTAEIVESIKKKDWSDFSPGSVNVARQGKK